MAISGAHKVNLGDMLDMVVDIIGKLEFPEEEEDILKLAVIESQMPENLLWSIDCRGRKNHCE